MDGERFDAWTRRWSARLPRRAALGLLAAAGASGPAARHDAEAAACVPAGQRCGNGKRCCADATCRGGRCRCARGAVACFAGLWRIPGVSYGLAVGAGGRVYVADADNNRILKFDADGSLLHKWGRFGRGDGEFHTPTGVAVDRAGHVYVADWDNHRVQRFDGDGTFLGKWRGFGHGDGQYDFPNPVAVDGNGHIYVGDHFNHGVGRIQKFRLERAGGVPPVPDGGRG